MLKATKICLKIVPKCSTKCQIPDKTFLSAECKQFYAKLRCSAALLISINHNHKFFKWRKPPKTLVHTVCTFCLESKLCLVLKNILCFGKVISSLKRPGVLNSEFFAKCHQMLYCLCSTGEIEVLFYSTLREHKVWCHFSVSCLLLCREADLALHGQHAWPQLPQEEQRARTASSPWQCLLLCSSGSHGPLQGLPLLRTQP